MSDEARKKVWRCPECEKELTELSAGTEALFLLRELVDNADGYDTFNSQDFHEKAEAILKKAGL